MRTVVFAIESVVASAVGFGAVAISPVVASPVAASPFATYPAEVAAVELAPAAAILVAGAFAPRAAVVVTAAILAVLSLVPFAGAAVHEQLDILDLVPAAFAFGSAPVATFPQVGSSSDIVVEEIVSSVAHLGA